MYEKATLKDGGIEQTNFDTYTPLRMSQGAGSREDSAVVAGGVL
jgi:hypothetical protein